jgi:hypothetical protein
VLRDWDLGGLADVELIAEVAGADRGELGAHEAEYPMIRINRGLWELGSGGGIVPVRCYCGGSTSGKVGLVGTYMGSYLGRWRWTHLALIARVLISA